MLRNKDIGTSPYSRRQVPSRRFGARNRDDDVGSHISPDWWNTNKNDRNHAEAIVEAASRPAMRFVSIKTVEQQDVQAAHRMRPVLQLHRRIDQPDAWPTR